MDFIVLYQKHTAIDFTDYSLFTQWPRSHVGYLLALSWSLSSTNKFVQKKWEHNFYATV